MMTPSGFSMGTILNINVSRSSCASLSFCWSKNSIAPWIMNWELLSPGCTRDVKNMTCFGFLLFSVFSVADAGSFEFVAPELAGWSSALLFSVIPYPPLLLPSWRTLKLEPGFWPPALPVLAALAELCAVKLPPPAACDDVWAELYVATLVDVSFLLFKPVLDSPYATAYARLISFFLTSVVIVRM